MSRVPLTDEAQVSPDLQSKYGRVTEAESGLSSTYRALFASPGIASKLSDLDELVRGQLSLEPWIRLTVALTVAHEGDNRVLWDSFEPLARDAGVNNAVIEAIAAGTAPRGLLPKDGIWVHFALEVLRGKMRDSTWQAVTHLVGESGAIDLALTASYYEMMVRLNSTFALDAG
ncbi:MAG: hypothetical protein IIB29_08115 [Chloroflexi bacterium]|nr:hypothetical protein [Chloroflexota bacterium]